LRAAFRIIAKATLALGLLAAVGACEQIPLTTAVTKPAPPAEPPPPTPVPPAAVRQEALPPPTVARPGAAARPVRVALLVPLSGQAAQVGQHLSNAAQLALFEVGGSNFTLQPFDTKGTPEGAAQAIQAAVAQDVDLVLGPLFSASVKAAAPVARAAGVNMIAFTTDRTAAGDGVFILGFLPRSQVARVVAHARNQAMTRFAVLAPDNEYGRAMTLAYRDVVTASGGIVTRESFYEPQSKDASAAVEQLAAGGPGAFEALLLPDEGVRLRGAAALLGFRGVDLERVQLLGTMLWDDPALGNEPALVGGWYPAPPQDAHQEFVRSYRGAFGSNPPPIASLAYDATALAAVLAQRPNPDFTAATLTQPSGFAGVDGIFRLLPDGTNQRGLAVMAVSRTGPEEVSPAPSSFAGPVY